MKYDLIISDPPYKFSDGLTMKDIKRGSNSNYQTMSIEDIIALPIKELASPSGCLLALWVPSSLLCDGLSIMQSYGFIQKQTFIWNKTKKNIERPIYDVGDNLLSMGMGRLFRNCHEICLIGINNTGIYKKLNNHSQRSVCFDLNRGHSTKTKKLHERLEVMFPDPTIKKLEVFGRELKDGWTIIGNQVCDGEDITVSLNKIIESQ